jgi:hypothetical protein
MTGHSDKGIRNQQVEWIMDQWKSHHHREVKGIYPVARMRVVAPKHTSDFFVIFTRIHNPESSSTNSRCSLPLESSWISHWHRHSSVWVALNTIPAEFDPNMTGVRVPFDHEK